MEEGKVHNDGSATLSKTVLSVAWSSSIFRIQPFSEPVQLHPSLPCAVSKRCSPHVEQLWGNSYGASLALISIQILCGTVIFSASTRKQQPRTKPSICSRCSQLKPQPDTSLWGQGKPLPFLLNRRDFNVTTDKEFFALVLYEFGIKPDKTTVGPDGSGARCRCWRVALDF